MTYPWQTLFILDDTQLRLRPQELLGLLINLLLSGEEDVLLIRYHAVHMITDLERRVGTGSYDDTNTVAGQRLVQVERGGVTFDFCRSHSSSHVRIERDTDDLNDVGAIVKLLVEVDRVFRVVLERLGRWLALGDGVEEELCVGSHFAGCFDWSVDDVKRRDYTALIYDSSTRQNRQLRHPTFSWILCGDLHF